MKLKVEHTTVFKYDEPVYETATEVRLHPDDQGAPQHCLEFTLAVDPPTNIFHYTDFYGNSVHHFNLLPRHTALEIIATSIVETGPGQTPARPDEELLLFDFQAESRFIKFDDTVQQFAAQFKDGGEPHQIAENICRYINQSFVYERGVTDTQSTASQVINLGRGVCQDFAHVMLAACRFLKIPARYVSGYIYGGPETEDSDRSSHAWCEVYCRPEKGWLGFDPTHKTLFVDERYIKIGAGRDYADVPPVRGTYKGNGKESLKVVVRVAALN